MGRPLKFKTPKELDDLIEAYWLNCSNNKLNPTKGGLAIYLDTTKETLGDYENKEGYSYSIKKAYNIIEESWVQALGNKQAVAGVIFYLKNAFKKDWRDRNETDITSGGKPIPILNVSANPSNNKDSEPIKED